MNILQAILIALFAYLSGEGIPWLIGDYLGYLVFAKPLMAGFVVGFILGDIQGGIILGAALQTIYIGTMIVGGVTSADEVSVSYIALPLALVSKGDVDVAIGIALTLGLLGTVIFNGIAVLNIFWIGLADKAAEKADYKGVLRFHVWGTQFTTFLIRFVPSFLIVYYGATVIPELASLAPQVLLDILSTMGGLLPVVGIGVIATMLINKRADIAYFLIGFVLIVYFNLDLIAVSVIAAIIAVIFYSNSNKNRLESRLSNDNEVEL